VLVLVLVLVLMLVLVMTLLARVLVRTLVTLLVTTMRRHDSLSTSQVDINSTSVFLGGILQPEFTADLLDARLDLLHVVGGVVALADDAGRVSTNHTP
jgi:hypothetical protein